MALYQMATRLMVTRGPLSTRCLRRANTIHPWTSKQYPFSTTCSILEGHQLAYHQQPSDISDHSSQATFLASTANRFIRQKILRTVKKRWRSSNPKWAAMQTNPWAVVILATPEFAEWIEEPAFISDVLSGLTRAQTEGLPPLELDVVCACIDQVSFPFDYLPYVHHERAIPHPGISILSGRSDLLLPGLWDDQVASSTHNSEMLSTITVGSSNDSTKIDMPLANTLFTNGRKSTLLVSRWQMQSPKSKERSERSFIQVKSKEKVNQVINALNDMISDKPRTFIAATPITRARRITSGLGNIVRQLDFGDGVGPASRELEEVVNKYVEHQKRANKKTAEVWALIIPEAIAPDPTGPLADKKFEKMMLGTRGRVQDSDSPGYLGVDSVGYWLKRGAKFCRVVSGGGGWGEKQGLLSLDPQTTYTHTDGTDLEFSGESLEEQQASALGNIAEPGSWIRFFVRKKALLPDAGGYHIKLSDPWVKSVTFGTARDTVDTKPDIGKNVVGQDRKVAFRPGHFGCQSHSGMFLRQRLQQDGPEVATKIDMPASYIYSYDPLAASDADEKRLEQLTGEKPEPVQETTPEDPSIRKTLP